MSINSHCVFLFVSGQNQPSGNPAEFHQILTCAPRVGSRWMSGLAVDVLPMESEGWQGFPPVVRLPLLLLYSASSEIQVVLSQVSETLNIGQTVLGFLWIWMISLAEWYFGIDVLTDGWWCSPGWWVELLPRMMGRAWMVSYGSGPLLLLCFASSEIQVELGQVSETPSISQTVLGPIL